MSRQFFSVHGNTQRLDGGAMFGNAPRALWEKWIEPDDKNRIPLCCRCLLIKDGDRNLLFESGIGAFFEPKLKERFGVVEREHILVNSLKILGLSPSDIDVVVLSHLHFDHAGGLLGAYEPNRLPEIIFDRAQILVSEEAFNRAKSPHPRDEKSYISELPFLLENSGRLNLIRQDKAQSLAVSFLGDGYLFHFSEGHTPGLMLTEIQGKHAPIVFAADLIPGKAWIRRAITMGYDRFPEKLIDEKEQLLSDIGNRKGFLFFTHDPQVAVAQVVSDDKGGWSSGAQWMELNGTEF